MSYLSLAVLCGASLCLVVLIVALRHNNPQEAARPPGDERTIQAAGASKDLAPVAALGLASLEGAGL